MGRTMWVRITHRVLGFLLILAGGLGIVEAGRMALDPRYRAASGSGRYLMFVIALLLLLHGMHYVVFAQEIGRMWRERGRPRGPSR